MTTAELLRKYRTDNKLTLRECATRLGTSYETIRNIEKGRDLRPDTARRLAKLLGVKQWHTLLTAQN
jgi:transcriptional regulator with XRE-family HTH domain